MRHKGIALVMAFPLTFLSLPVFSQEDACGCNSVLMDGIFSMRAQRGDSAASEAVKYYILNSGYEQYKKDVSGGGGVKWAGYGFNANMSKGEFEERRRLMISENSSKSSKVDSQSLLERFGDKEVIAAWSACKLNCRAQGVHVAYSVQDANNIRLQLRYLVPQQGTIPAKRVENSLLKNGVVLDPDVPDGKFLKPGESFTHGFEKIIQIKRLDAAQPVIAQASFSDMYAISEFIPVLRPSIEAPVLSQCDDSDAKILLNACDIGDRQVVEGIFNRAPQCLNHRDNIGETCLYIAAMSCHEGVVQEVLERGGDVNVQINGNYQVTEKFPLGRFAGWTPVSAARYAYVMNNQVVPGENQNNVKNRREKAKSCAIIEKMLLEKGGIDSAIYKNVPIGAISKN